MDICLMESDRDSTSLPVWMSGARNTSLLGSRRSWLKSANWRVLSSSFWMGSVTSLRSQMISSTANSTPVATVSTTLNSTVPRTVLWRLSMATSAQTRAMVSPSEVTRGLQAV